MGEEGRKAEKVWGRQQRRSLSIINHCRRRRTDSCLDWHIGSVWCVPACCRSAAAISWRLLPTPTLACTSCSPALIPSNPRRELRRRVRRLRAKTTQQQTPRPCNLDFTRVFTVACALVAVLSQKKGCAFFLFVLFFVVNIQTNGIFCTKKRSCWA